jgi:hypothetical protein
MLLLCPPGLQGSTRHVKHLGRLTLGHALRVQLAIPFQEVSPCEASPALVAIILATLLCLDYRCHSYLPYRSSSHVRSGGLRMAR